MSYYILDRSGRRWYYHLLSKRERQFGLAALAALNAQNNTDDDFITSNSIESRSPKRVLGKGLFDDHPYETIARSFIVQSQQQKGSRRFSVFNSPDDYMVFSSKIPFERRCFYETIIGPQKPHFDLDFNVEKYPDLNIETIKNYVIWAICKVMRKAGIKLVKSKDILLYSSHSDLKKSYHIVIDNYCHVNHKQAREFYNEVMKLISIDTYDIIDSSVYSSKQQFRIVGSHKYGSDRTKTFQEKWTYFTPENEVEVEDEDDTDKVELLNNSADEMDPMLAQLMKIKEDIEAKKPVNPHRKNLIEYEYPCEFNNELAKLIYINSCSAVSFVGNCKQLPFWGDIEENMDEYSRKNGKAGNKGDYDDIELSKDEIRAALKQLAVYEKEKNNNEPCPYSYLGLNGGMILLKRLYPSYCRLCCRIHENENPYMFIVGRFRSVYFNCRRTSADDNLLITQLGKRDDDLSDDDDDDKHHVGVLANEKKLNEQREIKYELDELDFEDEEIISQISDEMSKVVRDVNTKSKQIKKYKERKNKREELNRKYASRMSESANEGKDQTEQGTKDNRSYDIFKDKANIKVKTDASEVADNDWIPDGVRDNTEVTNDTNFKQVEQKMLSHAHTGGNFLMNGKPFVPAINDGINTSKFVEPPVIRVVKANPVKLKSRNRLSKPDGTMKKVEPINNNPNIKSAEQTKPVYRRNRKQPKKYVSEETVKQYEQNRFR